MHTHQQKQTADRDLTPEEFKRLQELDTRLYSEELYQADARLEALDQARREAVEAWLSRLEELRAQLAGLRRAYKEAEALYVLAANADRTYQLAADSHYSPQDPPEPTLPNFPGRFPNFLRLALT